MVNIASSSKDDASLVGILLAIVGVFIGVVLMIIIISYTLHTLRNKKKTITEIVNSLTLPIILNVLIGTIAVGLIAFISFILLIIPFFLIVPRLIGVIPAIIEGQSITQAFKTSFAITKGHLWYVWKGMIMSGIITVAGLVCLIVGIIPAAGISIILKTKIYTTLLDEYSKNNKKEEE